MNPQAFLQYTRDNKVMAIRSAYQLGDYFEAILAAVFLDSNSFESTWNVSLRVSYIVQNNVIMTMLNNFLIGGYSHNGARDRFPCQFENTIAVSQTRVLGQELQHWVCAFYIT